MKRILKFLLVSILTITIDSSVVNATELEMDVTSAQVTSLYNNVNVFKDAIESGDLHGYLYSSDSYDVNDLSNDAKLLIGSHKLHENNDDPQSATKAEMTQAIASVLGTGATYTDGVPTSGGCGISPYKYESEIYSFSHECGGTMYAVYYTKLLKAIKTDTTIEIYENAIYVEPVDEGSNIVKKIYTPDKGTLLATINPNEEDAKAYLNKGYVYKYIFTLDSNTGDYYFTSIQKVDYKFEEAISTEKEANVEESVVENPKTGLYIGMGGLSLIVVSLVLISKKKNKFIKIN